MKAKLKSVCEMIRMGYTFRSRFEPDPSGNIHVIQMRDINQHNRIVCEKPARWEAKNMKPSLLLEEGDVLLQARGFKNTAALVPGGLGIAIASAPLMILRLDCSKVLPEYIWWFLNHPQTQARLLQGTTGAQVRLISKSVLEQLDVVLPTLLRQKKIAKVAALAEREQELMEIIRKKRKSYAAEVLMQMTR
jgi:hypothetical protein